MKQSRWIIGALLLSGSLLLSGCSDSDMRDLVGFARMWAESHGLVDNQGRPDYWNIGMRAMGGSTGDEQADAVIDAGMTVKNLGDAEKKRDEAVKEKDLKKLDAAIKMRPKEFRYHKDKGALLLEQGNVNAAYDEFSGRSPGPHPAALWEQLQLGEAEAGPPRGEICAVQGPTGPQRCGLDQARAGKERVHPVM